MGHRVYGIPLWPNCPTVGQLTTNRGPRFIPCKPPAREGGGVPLDAVFSTRRRKGRGAGKRPRKSGPARKAWSGQKTSRIEYVVQAARLVNRATSPSFAPSVRQLNTGGHAAQLQQAVVARLQPSSGSLLIKSTLNANASGERKKIVPPTLNPER